MGVRVFRLMMKNLESVIPASVTQKVEKQQQLAKSWVTFQTKGCRQLTYLV